MGEADQSLWAERAVRTIDQAFPDPQAVSRWPVC